MLYTQMPEVTVIAPNMIVNIARPIASPINIDEPAILESTNNMTADNLSICEYGADRGVRDFSHNRCSRLDNRVRVRSESNQ